MVVVGFCLILDSVIKHFRYLPWKTAIASVWLTLLPLLQMFSANTMISAQQVSLGLALAVREAFSSFTFREGMNSLVLKDVTALNTDPTSDTELKQTERQVFPNISPCPSLSKSSHIWSCLFMVFNSHLPRVSRQEMRTGVKRLGVILHLFGLGQDSVDVWDGVILQATTMIGQNHFKWVHFGNKSCCTIFICPDTETLTCSNLMFTVKSPARRLSRMSLNVRKKHNSY